MSVPSDGPVLGTPFHTVCPGLHFPLDEPIVTPSPCLRPSRKDLYPRRKVKFLVSRRPGVEDPVFECFDSDSPPSRPRVYLRQGLGDRTKVSGTWSTGLFDRNSTTDGNVIRWTHVRQKTTRPEGFRFFGCCRKTLYPVNLQSNVQGTLKIFFESRYLLILFRLNLNKLRWVCSRPKGLDPPPQVFKGSPRYT